MNLARNPTVELLPEDEAFVSGKVKKGEYENASAVVRAALHALQEREAAFAQVLREEVLPAHDRLLADPRTVRPIDDVFARLRARHESRMRNG